MDTFEKAAKLLFSQAGPDTLVNMFYPQDAESENKLSTIKRNSENIRSATTMLGAMPSEIQEYAQRLRLRTVHDICGLYRGRMAAIVCNIFTFRTGHFVIEQTLQELQPELDEIVQREASEGESNNALVKFWRKLDTRCYTRLRANNPMRYDDDKFAKLKECAVIHLGTVLGMNFSADTTINPVYTHLLDEHLEKVCSRQTAPLS